MNQTITAVTGLEAGHYTDLEHATGCTVFLCREGAVGGVDVRGGSPGTRETDLLRPVHRVDQVHAVVLSGGSAFGLDAASGVVAYLESQGIGFKVGTKDNPVIVPIVSSAILYDLGLITSEVRPGPEEGRSACLAASAEIWCKPVTCVTTAVGYGIDDPRDDDLADDQRSRNQVFFATLLWEVTDFFQVGVECSRWETDYVAPSIDNQVDAVFSRMTLKF